MAKVWLVTGSASGLSLNVAEAVLASGGLSVQIKPPHSGESLLATHRTLRKEGREFGKRSCHGDLL
jgi:NAD(P)-dependent dehydrogenase (short-subunit alcohol dehydrogenase family)